MDGAGQEGLLGPAELSASSPPPIVEATSTLNPVPATDEQKDAALQAFIALVRSRPDLKDQVKAARNQDDVISLAAQQGFSIDSLTLLRSWSQVSDFSKPTWFGWFDD
ncbi:hypothetical protein DBR45_54425 [Pseudomonas sp. HMWF031]|nr:hypothetical protein DBR45_54425 [Pseudomonas sp. HMWF031]